MAAHTRAHTHTYTYTYIYIKRGREQFHKTHIYLDNVYIYYKKSLKLYVEHTDTDAQTAKQPEEIEIISYSIKR